MGCRFKMSETSKSDNICLDDPIKLIFVCDPEYRPIIQVMSGAGERGH